VTAQKENVARLLWMLGLAVTLPMILLSGPLAGYLVGEFLLVRHFGLTGALTPLLMVLGLMGSGLQAYRIIKRLKDSQYI
jgi:hypothetical protein